MHVHVIISRNAVTVCSGLAKNPKWQIFLRIGSSTFKKIKKQQTRAGYQSRCLKKDSITGRRGNILASELSAFLAPRGEPVTDLVQFLDPTGTK